MTPSKYQQDIFDFIEKGSGSAIINAVAGSGKTTTICNAAKLLPPGGNYWFGAFNKSIAEELKTRLPYFVQTSTFHSRCLDAYKRAFGKVKIDASKTKWLCQDNGLIPERSFWKTFPYVEKLIAYPKGTTDCPELFDFDSIIDHHDMDEPPDQAKRIAQQLLLLSLADTQRVDFDDMLWMTFHKGVEFVPKNDFIFVDEAQDLSGIQHELLSRMLKPGGRLVAVGDKHQAIYGFRGAHTNGMDELRDKFQAIELPLSISYRCSQAVVKEAQRILASPTAAQQRQSESPQRGTFHNGVADLDPYCDDEIPF